MVHVNVDIEHSWVHAQQLQDREHNVVDVAEARGFGLFGVVQPAGPVYGDVGLAVDELLGGVERGAGVERAVVPDAVKDGAVVTDVEFCEVGGELFGVFGGDAGLAVRPVRYRYTTPELIPIIFMDSGREPGGGMAPFEKIKIIRTMKLPQFVFRRGTGSVIVHVFL